MRFLRPTAILIVAICSCYGQTPTCPPVTFQTSSVITLQPSSTSHIVVAKQQDGSWTGYELANASPYRLIRTTPQFQEQLGPCAQFAAGNGGVDSGDVATLTSGQYLSVNPTATGGIDATLFDRNLNLVSENEYELPAFQTTYGTGGATAISVTLADVNADGIPDALVSAGLPDYNGSAVYELLGQGGSHFGPARLIYTARTIANFGPLVAADVNGDGRADILVAGQQGNGNSNTITLLIGNGNGTFQAPMAVFSAPGSIGAIAVGDLNGDGKPDLVVTVPDPTSDASLAMVALGTGNGAFSNPVSYQVAGDDSVTIADLNGDGKPDIVTDGVSILFGDGTGKFPTRQDYQARTMGSILVTDFNGDGRLDIVVGNGNPDLLTGTGLEVFYGRPDGTWSGAPLTQVPLLNQADNLALGMIAADFNGDGIPDLAFSDLYRITILQGTGDGRFQSTWQYAPANGFPATITTGDFNNDGIPDVAVGIYTSSESRVEVLLGRGDGTLSPPVATAVPQGIAALAAADFNGDGKQDLAVLISTENSAAADEVLILPGNGDGTFKLKGAWPAGPVANALVFGDFNGDGKLDLAIANTGNYGGQNGNVSVLLGNGDGTFTAGKTIPLSGGTSIGPYSIVAGDFNRDGRLDLAVGLLTTSENTGAGIAVLPGNGDGTFQSGMSYPYNATQLLTADLNGDGIPDLVPAGNNTDAILLGNGDGTFQPVAFPLLAPAAIADFNRDGKPDVATVGTIPGPLFGVAAFLNTTGPQAPFTVLSSAGGVPPPLAPESLATATGRNLASATQLASGQPLPTWLAGTSVFVRDAAGTLRAAELLYVSASQINFLIPAGTSAGTATITVSGAAGLSSQSVQVEIAPVAPSLFTLDSAGLAAAYVLATGAGGSTAIEPVDTSVSGSMTAAPIDVSSGDVWLVLFGTGIRNAPAGSVTVQLQGWNAVVGSAGPVPGQPGLDMVKVLLPSVLAGSGNINLVLTAGGIASNTVSITIQ